MGVINFGLIDNFPIHFILPKIVFIPQTKQNQILALLFEGCV